MNNFVKRFLQFVVIFVVGETVNICLRFYRTGEIDFSIHNWYGWAILAIVFFGVEVYLTIKKNKDNSASQQ